MKIGILGAGQLARMIALAGYPLGLGLIFLDPSIDSCANKLGEHLHGDYCDPVLLAQLAERADVVTYEFENVPAQVANYLAEHTKVYPPARALEVAQGSVGREKLLSRTRCTDGKVCCGRLSWGFGTGHGNAKVSSHIKIAPGYDGKGQSLLQSDADLKAAWQSVQGLPAIVEAFVPFAREVSIIAARSVSGSVVFYPLSENLHKGGILRIAESRANDPLQSQAEDYISRLLNALDYVGVMALELFDVDGELIANEFAPRVHNSGHWTIEGSDTSQFENHLRAILDLSLGSTQPVGKAAMVNFVGGLPKTEDVMAIGNAHLHLYDKSPRKGRKVAHATVCSTEDELFKASLGKLTQLANQVDDA